MVDDPEVELVYVATPHSHHFEHASIFITEAIWTRYMPLSMKVKELLDSGAIGEPRLLNASLCYGLSKNGDNGDGS